MTVQPMGGRLAGASGRRTRDERKLRGEGGAALVEFAIVVPVFFLLVFGIMEFGYAYFQQVDVRHGAREGARLAAVNYRETAAPTAAEQTAQMVAEVCDRMDADDDTSVRISRPGTAAIGQVLEVQVEKPLVQLTGFLGFALDGITLRSSVDSRIEQVATWQSLATAQDCNP